VVADQVVVDASVGIAYVRDEVATAAVDRAVAAWSRDGRRLVVPAVFWTEIVNVLGTKHRYRAAQTTEALRELDELGLETVEIGRPELILVADAMERHRMSAYDATYLVLAQQLNTPLATLDRQLAAAAGRLGLLVGEESGRGAREAAAPYGTPVAERPSSLPDYAGLGAYLGELRRRALAGTP
jgi:predicted nucleic acid-binding protein